MESRATEDSLGVALRLVNTFWGQGLCTLRSLQWTLGAHPSPPLYSSSACLARREHIPPVAALTWKAVASGLCEALPAGVTPVSPAVPFSGLSLVWGGQWSPTCFPK